MKYSVIIPAYNCLTTLAKTVSSIQACGLPDYEIILVDDGSTDGTSALCDRLSAENTDIRCFHQENQGVSAARNHGLDEARGDYVWFFDSDDLVDPGSMTRAAQIVEEHQPDMMIFGMSFDFYYHKRLYQRLELYYDREAMLTSEEIDELLSELYHNNALSSSCNKLFRRSVLIENGIRYDEKKFLMEDLLMVLKTLKVSKTVYYLPQVLYRYVHVGISDSDRAEKRLAKVPDLAFYLKPFEELLAHHQDILGSLYYMLLRQKLRGETPKLIARTAKTVYESSYASEKMLSLCSESDRLLVKKLAAGEYLSLYLSNRVAAIRRKLTGTIKRSPIYARFRGSIVRKVRW